MSTQVEIPTGWAAGPGGRIVPPDGWTEGASGVSIVTSGRPATASDVPTTVLCYRQTGQPPVLQPLFQGTLNEDGTVTLLDPEGRTIGTGTFGLDGRELDVTLADGSTRTIDLTGSTLQVADGARGSTFAIGQDGRLNLTATSVLGDGSTRIRVGSQLLLVPAGAVVTIDPSGHLFLDGTPLTSPAPPKQTTTTVQTYTSPRPAGMDTKLQLDDGSEITVGQYAGYLTVDIQSMSDLADCLDAWAGSVDYTMVTLDSRLHGIQAAIGDDDPGKKFMPDYKKWRADTGDGIKKMGDGIRNLARSLRDGADELFKTEDANLRKFIGQGAVDPRLQPADPDTSRRRAGGGWMF